MNSDILRVLDRLEIQSQLEKTRKVDVPSEDRMLAITKETGELLNMILRLKKARNALEVGMSTGYSTIWCAEAILENEGRITTIEQNPDKISRAQKNFEDAKVSQCITIRKGMAKEILSELSQEESKEFFDFVLIDADKENVMNYFDLILPMTSVGGVIVTDNMIYPEKYKEHMSEYARHIRRHQNVRTMTLPVGNGEEITMKLG